MTDLYLMIKNAILLAKLSVLKLTQQFFTDNGTKWDVIQLLLNLDLVLLFLTDDANLNELRTQIYEFVCTM